MGGPPPRRPSLERALLHGQSLFCNPGWRRRAYGFRFGGTLIKFWDFFFVTILGFDQ